MKLSVLSVALVAQFAAVGAFAQTDTTDSGSDTDATPMTYGTDWSPTLGPAFFREDGMMRSNEEIVQMWGNLSDSDKRMLRRDCDAQARGVSTDADVGEADANTGTSTSTATGPTDAGLIVSDAQLASICAATSGL